MRYLIICLFFCYFTTQAQTEFGQRMQAYGTTKNQQQLFVHFDKNIYNNSETAWFTGYIINRKDEEHKLMHVSLIRDIDSVVVIVDKFLIVDELAFGSINIPENLQPGNYRFIAYTDLVSKEKPIVVFQQPVTIQTGKIPSIRTGVKLMKLSASSKEAHQIAVSVYDSEGRFLKEPATVNYSYGQVKGSMRTDASGQALISVYPNQHASNINFKIIALKDSSFLGLSLPGIEKSYAKVVFYPEGGHLIKGISSRVAWEVRDQAGNPLALTAELLKDDKVIDTIETSSNGIGSFLLQKENSAISVRLLHSELLDSIYHLPRVESSGVTISTQRSLTKDTLTIYLGRKGISEVSVRVHNFRDTFFDLKVKFSGDEGMLKFPLEKLPRGIAAITVFDSLSRPLCERLFFAHYIQKNELKINLDSTEYKKRQKVTVKIKLEGTNDKALVSIACVQADRLSAANTTDIETFTYLESELIPLSGHFNFSHFHDVEQLDNILLVRGWRNYTWKEFDNQFVSLDTTERLRWKIYTSRSGKSPEKSIKFATFGGLYPTTFSLPSNGRGELDAEQLLAEPGQQLFLINLDPHHYIYQTNIISPFTSISSILGKEKLRNNPLQTIQLQNNTPSASSNGITKLKEVEIRLKNAKYYSEIKSSPDWVCSNGVLNCANHPNGSSPIVGKIYMTSKGIVRYLAHGKTESAIKSNYLSIDGVHVHKEFYVEDFNKSDQPAYLSTLYWNYSFNLSSENEGSFSFYTGDIPGKFTLVVQGISKNGTIATTAHFNVK